MLFAPELLEIAERIDAKVQGLINDGRDDATILAEMCDDMPDFKRLMDSVQPGGMDALCRRYAAFYYFAKVIENVAKLIASGQITVPKQV